MLASRWPIIVAGAVAGLVGATFQVSPHEGDTPVGESTSMSASLESTKGLSLRGEWTVRRFEGGWFATPEKDGASLVVGSSLGGDSTWSGRQVYLVVDEAMGWLHVGRSEEEARFHEKMSVAAARSKAEAEAEVESPTTSPEVSKVLHDLSRLDHLVQTYRSVKGSWPESLADLKGLKPVYPNAPFHDGSAMTDPWGRPYLLVRTDGGEPDLVSHGADGRPGGDGDARDVSLRAIAEERGYAHFEFPMSALSEWGSSGALGKFWMFDEGARLSVAEGRLGAALVHVVLKDQDRRDRLPEGFSLSHGALAGATITGGGKVRIRYAKRVE